MIQRRLSFESLDPFKADYLQTNYGKGIWQTLDFSRLTPWYKTVLVFDGDERMDQYRTLKSWADTHDQPIRNVTLEEREVQDANFGWKAIKEEL